MSYTTALTVHGSTIYRNSFAEETEVARVRRGLALRRAERATSAKSLSLVDFSTSQSAPVRKAA